MARSTHLHHKHRSLSARRKHHHLQRRELAASMAITSSTDSCTSVQTTDPTNSYIPPEWDSTSNTRRCPSTFDSPHKTPEQTNNQPPPIDSYLGPPPPINSYLRPPPTATSLGPPPPINSYLRPPPPTATSLGPPPPINSYLRPPPPTATSLAAPPGAPEFPTPPAATPPAIATPIASPPAYPTSATAAPLYYVSPTSDIAAEAPNTAVIYGSVGAGVIVGATVASVIAVITIVAAIAIFLLRRRRMIQEVSVLPFTPKQNGLRPDQQEESSAPTMDPMRLARSIDPSRYGPVSYTYPQLCKATDSFSSPRFLGKGGFGPVFKGYIEGVTVAIKCVDDDSSQGFKEFKAEVNIISDLRHRNLVKLRGWCYENTKFFLVYDYVPNGSLDRLLFDDGRCCTELSWERRFGIVLGLGSAVQYLHEESETVIIHRDIKSSNVLLDDKYVAKLGDFGLSRQIGDTQVFTTAVAGTRGYIAPEVFITGKSNKASDVFSFGAVLAEIACGKRVIDVRGTALVDWVWKHLSDGVLIKAADERLDGQFNEEEMKRVLIVSLACSHPDPSARPSIRQATDALRGTSPLSYVPTSKPVPSYKDSDSAHQSGDDATSSSYQGSSTSTSTPSTFTSHISFPSTRV